MPQRPPDLEHRWGERFPTNLPVQMAVHARSGIEGRLKNLSLSGALIESQFALRVKSLIEVTMHLPAPSQRQAVLKAHVIRKANEDIGIEWCEFAPSAVKELLRTIRSIR